jgi:GT2 family glycosyltransferase
MDQIDYRRKHFLALLRRATSSIRARGVAATLRLAARRLFPGKRQPLVLELYKDIGERQKVRFPESNPYASIIIPAHGQLDFTLRCLHSLSQCGDASLFEVILVDDASTDASGSVLPAIEGLRYLRNIDNRGFIASCNAGAALARGEFLVFLNNDTIVQPGWLDTLLRTFSSHPDTGLAGSKLVYPDGRLQEAGGIVFADGSAANYGRFEDPGDPRFNFVREADYCSGAAIALRRRVFVELGGFDAHYAPAYYEDTDLAMRVRQRGLKVRYQPASMVVHFEGASSGTDIGTGIKAFQARNQAKFFERWQAELAVLHPAPGLAAEIAANHRASRNILIIDSRTPTPDQDSGSLRMTELMALLIEQGCALSFFNQELRHDDAYSEALQQLGVEVWSHPWIKDVPAWLGRNGRRFDAIIVSRHYVLSPLLDLLRKFAPQAQLVFDSVDLHFLREQRGAERSGDPAAMRAAERTRRNELQLVRDVDATWVVSPVERDLLAQFEPDARVAVLSNIHQVTLDTPDFSARRDIVFVGGFRHAPNIDAARWLASEIFPRVREKLPAIRLHLVGADAPDSILALQGEPGVVLRGHVPDLEKLLDTMRLSVAPLRYGAGIKGKINQSLARGLPVVATSCAIEGMRLVDGEDVLRGDDAAELAAAIVRLYGDEKLWGQLRAGGIENTRRYFSREAARALIAPWLAGLRSA